MHNNHPWKNQIQLMLREYSDFASVKDGELCGYLMA